ncbi:MAG: leucine-rich repeat protein, partial [Eubacterium sp.]|nr:leucine-rich repeat protein [Eubacterium sp.]
MKKNFGKRFLSILLSVLMVVTMLPTFAVAALADDDKAVKEYMTDENKTGFEGTATWSDEYKAWSFDGTQYIKLDGAPLSGVTATSGFAISFDVLNEDESLNNRYFNFSDGTNGISMVGSNTEWVHRYRTDIKSGDYTRRYYSSDFIDDDYCIKTASTYGNNIYDIHKWNTMTVVMTADGYYSYYKDGELVATFRNNYVDTPNGDYVTDEDAANAIAGATDYFIGASDADANEGFKGYIRNVKIAVGTTYETAIKAYKQKMDGTIYNNMTAPYNAFIDANEAYDAYTYGEGTAADLNSASAALVAAALNMKPWNSAFDAKAYHEGNVADNGYSNVVYCSTGTSWNGSDAYNNLYTTIGSQNVKIAMPTNIVFAYDGVNDVYGPIVFEHTRNGSHNTNTKWVGADSSDWEMRDYWLGYIDNSSDANAYQQWPGTTITDITKTTGYSSTAEPDNLNYFGYSEASYKQNATSNTGNTRFYWNKLYFKGTPDTTKYYTKTYRQTFHMVGWQDNWFDSGNREGTIYSDNTQYVINYAPAYAQLTSSNSDTVKGKLDAIKNEGAIPVENYLSGGLSSVLGAIDALIAANPKNYDYSSDVEATVINCGLDIRTALNSASSSTVTPDGTGYEALREAITLTKPTYERGNSDNYYYAKLWNVFYKAFEAAQSNMTNLPTDGYSANSSAQNLADVLNEAYYELTNVIEENGESGNTEYTYDSETETLNIEPKDGTDGRMEDYDSANDSPFGNSTEVKEIVIDPSVTYIGAHAFDGLKNLETVTVPAGATYGEGAFANCPKLKTVIIVGTDGASEVRNVSKQDSPWILPTVTTVKLGEKLTDKSVTAIENDVFKDKTGTNFFVFNENATIPDEEGMFGGTAVIHGFSTSTAKDYYDNHTADSDFKQLDHGGAHEWTTPVTVLPTCTVDGYTQHVCKICDVVETYDTVDKLEHDWDEGETTPSTCTVEGFTIYTCKRCSSQKTDKIAPLDHDFTVFVETVAPTCTAQGYDVYKCSRCDATENKNETPVDPNAHDYQYSSTVAPTCSAVGY